MSVYTSASCSGQDLITLCATQSGPTAMQGINRLRGPVSPSTEVPSPLDLRGPLGGLSL